MRDFFYFYKIYILSLLRDFNMLRICTFILLLFPFTSSLAKKSLPVEYFNHLPMIQTPLLSPNGKKIVAIYNQGDDTQVAIVPFDNPSEFKILVKLSSEKERIDSINWVNDERIIISASHPFKIDTAKVRLSHLYSIGLDGTQIELQSNAYRIAKSDRKKYFSRSSLLSLLVNDPSHILVTSRDEREGRYSSVFKVNVTTGKYTKFIANKNRIFGWGTDKNGKILVAYGSTGNDKNQYYIYVRDTEQDNWEKIKTLKPFDSESFSPLIYNPDTHILTVLSDYKLDKEVIWEYDVRKKEYLKIIGEAPKNYDVFGGIYSIQDNEKLLVGYRYYDDTLHNVYFNKDSNKLNQDIEKLFLKKGLIASIYDYDESKKHYIISVVSDNKPVKYILFDAIKMKLIPWYSTFPELEKYALANVEPISFKARDGMDIYGYYSAPNNIKNPPVILFPHGGPQARDYRFFDPFVQMFTSRGYAVLQVNYRGSTGYGRKYQEAGYLEWGHKMQTDLIDGLNWVSKNKNANTNKACIVGASYGGYAALVAGFQTPSTFKCIASIAGISNMKRLVSHTTMRNGEDFVNATIKRSGDDLNAISPIKHVSEFKAPVLLIHGKADTRVDFSQSQKMHNALKAAGKKSKFVGFKYGTHNLNDAANRKVAMEELDVFLKKYLK